MTTNFTEQKNYTASRGFLWLNVKSRSQIENIGKSLRKAKIFTICCMGIIMLSLNADAYALVTEPPTQEYVPEFNENWYRQDWTYFPDETASDIAVGRDGDVWAVGENLNFDPGGAPIKKFIHSTSSWQTVDGAAVRIAVDNDGIPWVVNKSGEVYKRNGPTWEKLDAPENASDIATGYDGSVWIISQFGVYKLSTYNGALGVDWWELYWLNAFLGTATRLAVAADGKPWIVNSDNEIYRYTGSNWLKMPGRAIDIGSGGNRVWVAGDDEVIFYWDENNNTWQKAAIKIESVSYWLPVKGKTVSVDNTGHPWVINSLYNTIKASATSSVFSEYSRLQNNLKQDHYLHVEYGQIEASTIDDTSWQSAQWAQERIPDTPYFRLRNKLENPDPCYLHIENGLLECSDIDSGWHSAQWKKIWVEGTNNFRLQNRWQPDQYIHIENGEIEAGPIESDWASAQWKFDYD